MRDESPLEALFRAPESRFYLEGGPAFVLACRNARKYAVSDMTTWRKVRLPALAPGIVGPGNTARQHPVQSPDKVVTSSTRSLYPRSRRYVLLPNYGNRVDELPSGDSSQSAAPSSPGSCPCSLSCQWEWAQNAEPRHRLITSEIRLATRLAPFSVAEHATISLLARRNIIRNAVKLRAQKANMAGQAFTRLP